MQILGKGIVNNMKKSQKIAAGIVLYNPDIERLKENIRLIFSQVNLIILIDNASLNFKEVYEEFQNEKKIIIIANKKNEGIAKALNQIVKYCENNQFNWVLTLDQDSVSPKNLIESYSKYLDKEKVGIITPHIVDRNNKMEISLEEKKEPRIEYVNRCITSASLINIPICKLVGYFDEKMFIDLVDFEYAVRIRKEGFMILKVNSVSLLHQLGNLKVYNLLGKSIYVTNHSAIRNYFYARNSIYYLKKHKDYLSSREIYLKILIKILKILFFENKKRLKCMSIFKGLITGMKMQ